MIFTAYFLYEEVMSVRLYVSIEVIIYLLWDNLHGCSFKVACRVQIWKKAFCQNIEKFDYSFI